jgi:AbrB family looped-hinge helix DNA binding protein
MVARSSKIRRKSQVTIPIEIMRDMHWKEGDRVAFERKGDIVELRPAQGFAERTAGILAKYRLPVPLTPEQEREAFGQAVADEVAEQMRNE